MSVYLLSPACGNNLCKASVQDPALRKTKADMKAAEALKANPLRVNAHEALTALGKRFVVVATQNPGAIVLEPVKQLFDFNSKFTAELITHTKDEKAIKRNFQDHLNFLNGCNEEFLRIKAKLKPKTVQAAQTRCRGAADKCFAELAKWEAQTQDWKLMDVPKYPWNAEEQKKKVLQSMIADLD